MNGTKHELFRDTKNLGEIDISQLKEVIEQCSEQEWQENLLRQQQFEVHYQTQSLLLLFVISTLGQMLELIKNMPGINTRI